jgi:radical SAM protein with 4Fe4S-binding SPASM domain
VLESLAGMSQGIMVVLTGGEPLLRPDLLELVRHTAALGLMVVVGTNAILLDQKKVTQLKEAGVHGVGISLDSLDPAYHDQFRGAPGAWDKTMGAIDACRNAGLPFQIHFSATEKNAGELDNLIAFARSAGALVLNVFFLVCTGRGEKFSDISQATYHQALKKVTEAAHKEKDLLIRAKCAPHFKRLALELDSDWPITLAHGYDAGGCRAATRYCRVTPEGDVTPCPYMEVSAGSTRETDLADLWAEAPLFESLRHPQLEGRCGACEYSNLCGGCRARPLALSGELMGEDSLCDYQPEGGAVIMPMAESDGGISWSPDANTRLQRIPIFVRRMVQKRVEEHVRSEGRLVIVPEDMHNLVRNRFGNNLPVSAPFGRKPDLPKYGDETHDN